MIARSRGNINRWSLVHRRIKQLSSGIVENGEGYRIVKLGASAVAVTINAKLDGVVVPSVAGYVISPPTKCAACALWEKNPNHRTNPTSERILRIIQPP